jgi:hypothetical protein
VNPQGSSPHPSTRAGGDLDALLQPSLMQSGQAPALYSVRASFLVAFFGGVYAALLFCWLNVRKLNRTRQDAVFFVALALLWTGLLGWFAYATALDQVPSWLSFTGNTARDGRYLGRIAGMLAFGLVYLRLRRFFKAAQLAGMAPPSPWKPALIIIAASAALTFVVAAVGAMLAGTAPP